MPVLLHISHGTTLALRNVHRRKFVHVIEHKLLLSTKILTLKKRHVNKFCLKFINLFKILEIRANGAEYKLEMPIIYTQIRPVFHISLLKKCTADENGRYSPTPSSYDTSNSELELTRS